MKGKISQIDPKSIKNVELEFADMKVKKINVL